MRHLSTKRLLCFLVFAAVSVAVVSRWIGFPVNINIDPCLGVRDRLELGMTEAEAERINGKPMYNGGDGDGYCPVYQEVYAEPSLGFPVKEIYVGPEQVRFRHGLRLKLNIHYLSQIFVVEEGTTAEQLRRRFGCGPPIRSTGKWEQLPPLSDAPCYLAGMPGTPPRDEYYLILGTRTMIAADQYGIRFMQIETSDINLYKKGKSVLKWEAQHSTDTCVALKK